MKMHICLIFSLLVLLSQSSCIGDDYRGPEPYPSTRTVLFYLAADNNVGAEIGLTPELLRQGWTYTGNRCLIYYDAPEAPPVLLSLRGGCQTYPVPFIETVVEYPEQNSASTEVFARVVRDVVERYPADDYGLVFASHASGWMPEGALQNPAVASARGLRSIGKDTEPGTIGGGSSEMELVDFAAAVPDHQFSFIVFEACLMAGVEAAYELRNKTDYILASSAEMLSPGYGVVYAQASHYLFDTRLTVEQSLRGFAGCYFDYMNTQTGWRRSATQSIVRTTGLNELAVRTKEVFTRAGTSNGDAASELPQHFDRPGSYGDTQAEARYFDFAQYMEQIATPGQYAVIEAELSRMVVWAAATPEFLPDHNGFRIERHSGLTTYIEQEAFPMLNAAYRQTAWYAATR